MKSDKLQDAVGLVRDDFVKDAEYRVERQAKVYPWVKWVAAAACLAVAALIAVPALSGKAPEVEPEPTEPTPIEEPAVESADEPVTMPEIEIRQAHIRVATEAQFDESVNIRQSSGAAAGVAGEVYTYEDYLRDYEAVTQNPVFAALFASQTTQQYDVIEVSAFDNVQAAVLAVDGFSKVLVNSAVQVYHNGVYYETDWEGFAGADNLGVLITLEVDGIEIQKYCERDVLDAKGYDTPDEPMPNPDNDPDIAWINFTERSEYTRWERLQIDGEWYLVYGTNEAEVDEFAAALAHIAATL